MAPAPESSAFLHADDIHRAITRIAHEILERNRGPADIVLLGIPTRGVPLAARIAAVMSEIEGIDVPAGALDVGMFRDDLRLRPTVGLHPTVIPGDDVTDRIVVLVDDVLFSGRTIRAAMDALVEVGRPRSVQLAVLVDRGHRELPIKADYVGKNVPTSREDSVAVALSEIDGYDAVTLERGTV